MAQAKLSYEQHTAILKDINKKALAEKGIAKLDMSVGGILAGRYTDLKGVVHETRKPGARIMYALVNYKEKMLVDPHGQFFTGLPDTMASIFCFATEVSAEHFAKRYINPKFVALAVNIDSKGFPSPVTK